MSQAQRTLLFRPQTPPPCEMTQVTIAHRFTQAALATPRQIHQPLPGLPSSGRAISSVISPREGSPSTHLGSGSTSASLIPVGIIFAVAALLILSPYAVSSGLRTFFR